MCRDIKLLLAAEVDGLETTQKNLTVFSSVLLHSFLLLHAGSSCSFCSPFSHPLLRVRTDVGKVRRVKGQVPGD